MTQGRAARASRTPLFTPDDVLYCAMPLYHGNALNANLFPALRSGATIALRRQFSASAFLPDAQRYGVTFFNTVGRALNHILATPETDRTTAITRSSTCSGPRPRRPTCARSASASDRR